MTDAKCTCTPANRLASICGNCNPSLVEKKPKLAKGKVMKILVYQGKHGNVYWNASTAKLEEKAWKACFKYLDEEYDMYCNEKDDDELNEKKNALVDLKDALACNLPRKMREETQRQVAELEDEIEKLEEERADYRKAAKGIDVDEFLLGRQDYEYEYVSLEEVEEP